MDAHDCFGFDLGQLLYTYEARIGDVHPVSDWCHQDACQLSLPASVSLEGIEKNSEVEVDFPFCRWLAGKWDPFHIVSVC